MERYLPDWRAGDPSSTGAQPASYSYPGLAQGYPVLAVPPPRPMWIPEAPPSTLVADVVLSKLLSDVALSRVRRYAGAPGAGTAGAVPREFGNFSVVPSPGYTLLNSNPRTFVRAFNYGAGTEALAGTTYPPRVSTYEPRSYIFGRSARQPLIAANLDTISAWAARRAGRSPDILTNILSEKFPFRRDFEHRPSPSKVLEFPRVRVEAIGNPAKPDCVKFSFRASAESKIYTRTGQQEWRVRDGRGKELGIWKGDIRTNGQDSVSYKGVRETGWHVMVKDGSELFASLNGALSKIDQRGRLAQVRHADGSTLSLQRDNSGQPVRLTESKRGGATVIWNKAVDSKWYTYPPSADGPRWNLTTYKNGAVEYSDKKGRHLIGTDGVDRLKPVWPVGRLDDRARPRVDDRANPRVSPERALLLAARREALGLSDRLPTEKAKLFKQHAREFETRILREKQSGLKVPSDKQIAETYKTISNLLSDLNRPRFGKLATELMHNVARPRDINQRGPTCNAAVVEVWMASRHPEKLAKMVSSAAREGSVVTADGRTVKLPDKARIPGPGQAAFDLRTGGPSGERNWASQLAQKGLINLIKPGYTDGPPHMNRSDIIESSRQATGERVQFFPWGHVPTAQELLRLRSQGDFPVIIATNTNRAQSHVVTIHDVRQTASGVEVLRDNQYGRHRDGWITLAQLAREVKPPLAKPIRPKRS